MSVLNIIAKVLGWIVIVTFGLALVYAVVAVAVEWYRNLRYGRRERQAQAMTLRARRERQLQAGRPMGALHPEHGSAMTDEERERLGVIEDELSNGNGRS